MSGKSRAICVRGNFFQAHWFIENLGEIVVLSAVITLVFFVRSALVKGF
jgi:hypothetical protein